ncbi:MAG: hypothetical protein R2911_31680 [Caldilineaceae bacterium]
MRVLLEDKPSYLEMLRTMGASTAAIHQIDNYNSSILLHPVTSDAVQSAFSGETNTRIVDGPSGAPVLSSYGRLNLEGLEWSLFSEIAVAEAFAPVYTLEHNMLIWGVSLILGVSFLAILLALTLSNPLKRWPPACAGCAMAKAPCISTSIPMMNLASWPTISTKWCRASGNKGGD